MVTHWNLLTLSELSECQCAGFYTPVAMKVIEMICMGDQMRLPIWCILKITVNRGRTTFNYSVNNHIDQKCG